MKLGNAAFSLKQTPDAAPSSPLTSFNLKQSHEHVAELKLGNAAFSLKQTSDAAPSLPSASSNLLHSHEQFEELKVGVSGKSDAQISVLSSQMHLQVFELSVGNGVPAQLTAS